MFNIKHKKNLQKDHRTHLYGIAILIIAVFSLTVVLWSPRAEAAAPKCSVQSFGGGNGGIVDCDSSIPVSDSSNGIQPDHCYELQTTSFGPVYFNMPCDQLPFNQDIQSVRCADGTTQHGTISHTKAQICKNNGGVWGDSSAARVDCKVEPTTADNCGIIKYILIFTDTLAAAAGIVIVIMIVAGGIQYSASRDNPQAVAAARGKIINAVMALVFFVFAFAFLQWLIPGGLFK